ncbi:hypothetical protein Tsubulata_041331 [Turnera subulata]|uniref:Thiamine pyrophosphate enzyme central domain-containing protein n=1 Tax=Turnera subulata TaxID=218843 RepID=A0A9Q0F7H1_9ROSI|nr:hypothetical protein Tsubulata_041331 [Turnera subulata]
MAIIRRTEGLVDMNFCKRSSSAKDMWDQRRATRRPRMRVMSEIKKSLGVYPVGDDLSMQMLGMHGIVYANYSVDKSDLLLAFGVRFDDRVTGKLEAFASRARIVHIVIEILLRLGRINRLDVRGAIQTMLDTPRPC